MESVLPPHVLSNWKLLKEKVTSTVLDRGILIPHPREDYDLLEERLLESLELRMPRILACGHFHPDAEEEAELLAAGEEFEDEDDDADICSDCGRRIRDGRHGAGTGSRRWDIKLFAANGLMRAGAWGAVWREMERVDVEICPWIGEELKRGLEMAREAEEQDEALRRASEEETSEHVHLEGDTQMEDEAAKPGLDDARMREIYGEADQPYMGDWHSPKIPSPSPDRTPSTSSSKRPTTELPLSTLLVNYVAVLAQDPRNIMIGALSLLVLLLALTSGSRSKTSNVSPSMNHYIPSEPSTMDHAVTTTSSTSTWSSSTVPPSSVSTTSVSTVEEAPPEPTAEDDVQAQTVEAFVEDLEARFDFE